jgi:ketosteroid isomerase-like protein
MKRPSLLMLTLFSIMAASTGWCAAPGPPQETGADEQLFLQLQHQWAEARKHADMQFLESFYAKEFTVGLMDGGEASRAQDLAMFSSGDLKPGVINDRDMHVAVYGETAMVTGLEHLEGTYKGRTGQFDVRFTNVFVHRDGRWQIVRHQAAQVRSS